MALMSSHRITDDDDAHDVHDLPQDKDTHPGLHLALNLLADHDDDADTASQHSISFTSSSAASPRDSPTSLQFSAIDISRRQSHPYTISTESSDDPDDTSLYNGRASSLTSPGVSELDYAKQVPPTSLPAALQNNVYPPARSSSPGRASVTSLATSSSSYSKKVRPESLLMDPPKGPLVLGIALVDFNHQVRS